MTPSFPLSAIVGQELLVEALLVNAVAPEVGGVLVRGERGTAKSTAARALAPLLGGAAPFVELPLGATLDRLVGALDLGRALEGEHAVQRGLLAAADGGILYVDEVNLLPDHLVDALLDAAASGVARVERDAVSVEHDARFLLVGTMNVEEGELRPQLLDRFGLGVEVAGAADPAVRAEIVRRRLDHEADPAAFRARWAAAEDALAARIAAAREALPAVRLPERELLRITGACAALGIDGARGDIVTARAARALAALGGAGEVEETHVRRAAALALAHRRRRDPLAPPDHGDEELQRALDGDGDGDGPPEPPVDPGGGGRTAGASSQGRGPDPGGHAPGSSPAPARTEAPAPAHAPRERRDPPAPARLPLAALRLDAAGRGPHGRRARAAGPDAGAIDSRPADDPDAGTDLAAAATLRARLAGGAPGARRINVRGGREGALLCLVVDASGSMAARARLARVKGALLAVLRDAYARRDRVALLAFRDGGAEVLVAPGTPVERAAAAIRDLPAGGRTPLAAGLDAATRLITQEARRDPHRRAIAVVLTDGRVPDPHGHAALAARRLGHAAAALHVVDTEDGPVRLGLAGAIAAAGSGALHHLVPDRKAA